MKKTAVKYMVLLAFMISGCSADLKTKDLAKSNLQDNALVLIDNAFDLRYVENHSIAFGFLGEIQKSIRMPLIFLLTISATLLVFFMVWKMKHRSFRILLPFFVLLGGAYGNILDRLFNGFVTDFFHVHYFYAYNFPVFNVADVLVNIAAFLVIIQWRVFKPVFDEFFSGGKELTVSED